MGRGLDERSRAALVRRLRRAGSSRTRFLTPSRRTPEPLVGGPPPPRPRMLDLDSHCPDASMCQRPPDRKVGRAPKCASAIHPNYHSVLRRVAGNWPPGRGWPTLAGIAGKNAGLHRRRLRRRDDEPTLRRRDSARDRRRRPRHGRDDGDHALDLQGRAGDSRSPKEGDPEIVHRDRSACIATFMYKQVLSKPPGSTRGGAAAEGEEIIVDLCTAVLNGRWPQDRNAIRGLASVEGDTIVASPRRRRP